MQIAKKHLIIKQRLNTLILQIINYICILITMLFFKRRILLFIAKSLSFYYEKDSRMRTEFLGRSR